MIDTLAAHTGRSKAAKFIINDRDELVPGALVALVKPV
jgi:hypothetical protein